MAESTSSSLLIALGDSITAGMGGKWNKGYAEHLHKLLRTQITDLKLVNWGIPGLTIPRLTKALKKGEHLHADLTRATCIVMTICGNDIINAFKKSKKQLPSLPDKQIETLHDHLEELLHTIRTFTSCPLYLGDLYNPFPQSIEAGAIIEAVNQSCLYSLPSRHSGVYIVRVSEALRGLEADHIQYYDSGTVRDLKKFWRSPIHPNDQGHMKIAQSFYQSIMDARSQPTSTKSGKPKRRKVKRPK